MKKCENCKAELKENAKFCTNCGTPIEGAVPETIVATENQKESVETETTSQSETKFDEMVDVDAIQTHFFDYVDFVKNSLLSPTRVMDDKNISWIHGLVSIILYALLTTWFNSDEFLMGFIKGIAFQGAFAGLLFLLNTFLFKNKDDYVTTVYKYGSLLTTQVFIFLLLNLFVNFTEFAFFLIVIAVFNHINIFNTYILHQQEKQPQKMDKYYQLVLSYIPFVLIAFFNPF